VARFVILEHASPRGLHWDLMLQTGEVLATWALAEPPRTGATIAAEALPDHRPFYLDYEGPISGGRGAVARWDQGTYEFEAREPDRIVFQLRGEKLTGRATLVRSAESPAAWQFSFTRQ
jgi:hypothetical protein